MKSYGHSDTHGHHFAALCHLVWRGPQVPAYLVETAQAAKVQDLEGVVEAVLPDQGAPMLAQARDATCMHSAEVSCGRQSPWPRHTHLWGRGMHVSRSRNPGCICGRGGRGSFVIHGTHYCNIMILHLTCCDLDFGFLATHREQACRPLWGRRVLDIRKAVAWRLALPRTWCTCPSRLCRHRPVRSSLRKRLVGGRQLYTCRCFRPAKWSAPPRHMHT